MTTFPARAQNGGPENLDYQRMIHRDSDKLTNSRTGESINLADGSITIDQVDLSIPGNNGMDIVVRRSLSLSGGPSGSTMNVVGFGGMWWNLDLPRIKTVTQLQWITRNPGQPYARCSTNSTDYITPPDVRVGTPGTPNFYSIHAVSYWSPPSLEVEGDRNVLLVPLANSFLPSNGSSIKWVTKGRSAAACLPSVRNGQGEGYVVFTADGKKYTFDWMAKRPGYAILGVPVTEHSLYATRVEDGFGNWIEYDYEEPPATHSGVRLIAIRSNDGRQVDFGYNASQLVTSVSTNGRVWTYDYVYMTYGGVSRPYLNKVTLPDGSSRSFESDMLVHPYLGNILKCASGNPESVQPQRYFKLTEPSGLSVRYDLKAQRFGRSGIPACQVNLTGGPVYSSVVFSLSKRTQSGPGVVNAEWLYRYESHAGHFPFVAGYNLTEIKSPDASLRQFKYGNTYLLNEGLPLAEFVINQAGAVVSSKSYSYSLAPNTYGVRVGINPRSRMSGTDPNTDYRAGFEFIDEHLRPPIETSITLDGVVFKQVVEEFDNLVRPTRIKRSSALQ